MCIFTSNLFVTFLPEASFGLRVLSLAASVCVCVCLCVNHLSVHLITHDSFKRGSPNLGQRCRRPWFKISVVLWSD